MPIHVGRFRCRLYLNDRIVELQLFGVLVRLLCNQRVFRFLNGLDKVIVNGGRERQTVFSREGDESVASEILVVLFVTVVVVFLFLRCYDFFDV